MFRKWAREFQVFWPIFKVQELRWIDVAVSRFETRSRTAILKYLDAGTSEQRPFDPGNPRAIGCDFPLTWTNTLPSIYRVRCNLFHGDKCLSSESDQEIVAAAFRVLIHFFHELLFPQLEGPNEDRISRV